MYSPIHTYHFPLSPCSGSAIVENYMYPLSVNESEGRVVQKKQELNKLMHLQSSTVWLCFEYSHAT
jgi:hypothetical protein